MKAETRAFAPIRLCIDSQREWIATCEIGLLREDAKNKAKETDNNIPGNWVKMNPVQRIAKIKITEE